MTPHTDTDLQWLDDLLADLLVEFGHPHEYMMRPVQESAYKVAKTAIANKLASELLEARIAELENIKEQYGEFRDETLGKPIDLKAVTLYRIKHRIDTLKASTTQST